MAIRFGPIKKRVRARIKATGMGSLPTPRLHDAIRRAQEINSATLLLKVRNRYIARHNRGLYNKSGTSTVEGYESRGPRSDLTISIFNRRRNAKRIERGVAPKIGMRPAGSGRLASPPGRKIEAAFGTNLSFFWAREGVWFSGPFVHHPGQEADPIMHDTLEESRDEMFETIMDEVSREMNRG